MLGASEVPPHEAETQIVPRALVIGGSVGGLVAAFLLAENGRGVTLVWESAGAGCLRSAARWGVCWRLVWWGRSAGMSPCLRNRRATFPGAAWVSVFRASCSR